LSTAYGHQIFPVQVTNSNLDLDTKDLPASKMVFWKETANVDTATGSITGITKDPTWGGRTNGIITLTVGNGNEICGVTQTAADGTVTCQTPIPDKARPTSTPIGLLLGDASGFQVVTTWYVPALDGCTRGQSYITIHQISAGGTVAQRVGIVAADEPVTSPVILGGRIYVFGSNGAKEITGLLPDTVTAGLALPTTSDPAKFIRLNWREAY